MKFHAHQIHCSQHLWVVEPMIVQPIINLLGAMRRWLQGINVDLAVSSGRGASHFGEEGMEGITTAWGDMAFDPPFPSLLPVKGAEIHRWLWKIKSRALLHSKLILIFLTKFVQYTEKFKKHCTMLMDWQESLDSYSEDRMTWNKLCKNKMLVWSGQEEP